MATAATLGPFFVAAVFSTSRMCAGVICLTGDIPAFQRVVIRVIPSIAPTFISELNESAGIARNKKTQKSFDLLGFSVLLGITRIELAS